MNKDFLTPEEVAEYLRVEERTVKGWLRAGKLGGVLLAGSLWRIRRGDLDAFLAHWERRPSAAPRRESGPGVEGGLPSEAGSEVFGEDAAEEDRADQDVEPTG